jgi:hypothetical protein
MTKSKIVVTPPFHELLLFGGEIGIGKKLFLDNPELKMEIDFRIDLINCLKKIFDCLPNSKMNITEAMDLELIDFFQAKNLYEMLAKFFQAKESNSRLLLYLPFELIPDKKWKTNSISLSESISKFHKIYLKTWKKLLLVQDIRSCFTDGDIPEDESEYPIPKVVKAAHLAWILVKKELISFEEVIKIIETSQDEVLKESLRGSVKVMEDLGLSTVLKIKKSNSQEPLLHITNLSKLILKFNNAITCLENDINSLTVSSSRKKWLWESGRERIICDFSHMISSYAVDNWISITDFKKFTRKCFQDESLTLLAIETIVLYLEKLCKEGESLALNSYSLLKSEIEFLSESQSTNVKNTIKRLELRLSHLGINGKTEKVFPGEKFSLKLAMDENELDELIKILEFIKTDEKLSKMLFPVVLLYGSKVKGYGSIDFDLAILVRPWVNISLRPIIQKSLSEIIKNTSLQISFLEFWLEWEEGHLKIRDFKDIDTLIGGNNFAHVLFESAWIGSLSDVEQIFNSLISRFFISNAGGITQAIKPLLLQEIERNTLQFRLMHKGYSYMYPSQRIINTSNSSAIDSNSSFWDGGYRQLATKLFVSKVFL